MTDRRTRFTISTGRGDSLLIKYADGTKETIFPGDLRYERFVPSQLCAVEDDLPLDLSGDAGSRYHAKNRSCNGGGRSSRTPRGI